MFGRATIRLGIGPHSSFHFAQTTFAVSCLNAEWMVKNMRTV